MEKAVNMDFQGVAPVDTQVVAASMNPFTIIKYFILV
jgi:hypothetical protein